MANGQGTGTVTSDKPKPAGGDWQDFQPEEQGWNDYVSPQNQQALDTVRRTTQFEKERPGPLHEDQHGEGFASHLGSRLKDLVVGQAKTELSPRAKLEGAIPGVTSLRLIQKVLQDDKARQAEGRSKAYRAGAPLAESSIHELGLPMDTRAMEHAADVGDRPGVLGEAAAPVATLAAGEVAGRAAPGARRIGTELTRDPVTGSMRPGAELAAQVAGGGAGYAAGAAIGHPYAGGALGYRAGPGLMEAMFPKPKAIPDAATGVPRLKDQIATGDAGTGADAADTSGVTKLPIGSEKGRGPLTPEQVPGKPQLKEIAQGGDPRAGRELQRRGEKVLYVPEGGYAPPREKISLKDLMEGKEEPKTTPFEKPKQTKKKTAPEGEDEMERLRRRPPGISPTVKSVRRNADKVRKDNP